MLGILLACWEFCKGKSLPSGNFYVSGGHRYWINDYFRSGSQSGELLCGGDVWAGTEQSHLLLMALFPQSPEKKLGAYFSLLVFLRHISLLWRLFIFVIFDITAWKHIKPVSKLNTRYRILSEKILIQTVLFWTSCICYWKDSSQKSDITIL